MEVALAGSYPFAVVGHLSVVLIPSTISRRNVEMKKCLPTLSTSSESLRIFEDYILYKEKLKILLISGGLLHLERL